MCTTCVIDASPVRQPTAARDLTALKVARACLTAMLLWCCCRRISASYWQVVLISMVAPFAGTFWDTSALVTCTRNFPAERGTIIGIVKACMGGLQPLSLPSRSWLPNLPWWSGACRWDSRVGLLAYGLKDMLSL